MASSILREELWDSSDSGSQGEHDQDGIVTAEQKWDDPIEARYGGDELWASKALNAGTDIQDGTDELEIKRGGDEPFAEHER